MDSGRPTRRAKFGSLQWKRKKERQMWWWHLFAMIFLVWIVLMTTANLVLSILEAAER